MSEILDPEDMTPDERLQVVAAILARGILRCAETRGKSAETHASSRELPGPP